MTPEQKPTISELEAMLRSDDDQHIHIEPDGSLTVREVPQTQKPDLKIISLEDALKKSTY